MVPGHFLPYGNPVTGIRGFWKHKQPEISHSSAPLESGTAPHASKCHKAWHEPGQEQLELMGSSRHLT